MVSKNNLRINIGDDGYMIASDKLNGMFDKEHILSFFYENISENAYTNKLSNVFSSIL